MKMKRNEDQSESREGTGLRRTFRSDRFFNVVGQGWYVETRIGIKGPFLNKHLAERFLELLKQRTRWRREQIWPDSPTTN